MSRSGSPGTVSLSPDATRRSDPSSLRSLTELASLGDPSSRWTATVVTPNVMSLMYGMESPLSTPGTRSVDLESKAM